MKVKELKLYNKYKNINNPDKEYIYIGIGNNGFYWFLNENEDYNLLFTYLKNNGFDPDKIIKDLNLETYTNIVGIKYIKGYNIFFYSKYDIKTYFKPILKDKINNILNR